MKCEDYRALLEEYLDGELAGGVASSIAEHLTVCRSCASAAGELKREQEIYAGYERDVELTPTLWAGVRARIELEKMAGRRGLLAGFRGWLNGLVTAPRPSPALIAAMVVLAIGVTVGVTSYVNSRRARQRVAVESSNPVAPAPTPPEQTLAGGGAGSEGLPRKEDPQNRVLPGHRREAPVFVRIDQPRRDASSTRAPSAQQLIREAEQKYAAAIAILSRDFSRHRATMDPKLLARFDRVLRQIDLTIAETRRAYRQNPQDPMALQYLLAAYSKKVEVLREVTLN